MIMVFGSPLFYKCIFISEKDWTEWISPHGNYVSNHQHLQKIDAINDQ